MKTQKENNSDGRIEDALTTRILILTLAAIKAGKVTEEKTDRNHGATGSADGRPGMNASLTITKITLTGITIASGNDHNEDLLRLVTALELQAAPPLEPHGHHHGTVLVVSAFNVAEGPCRGTDTPTGGAAVRFKRVKCSSHHVQVKSSQTAVFA